MCCSVNLISELSPLNVTRRTGFPSRSEILPFREHQERVTGDGARSS